MLPFLVVLVQASSDDAVWVDAGSHQERLVQWLECADSPRPDIHSFAAERRSDWREPRINDLCCFPQHGRCFRAVFDGRIDLDKDHSDAECEAFDHKEECASWAAAGECKANEAYMQRMCPRACSTPATPEMCDHSRRVAAKDYLTRQIEEVLVADFETVGTLRAVSRYRTYKPTTETEARESARPLRGGHEEDGNKNWSSLHADYYESPNYMFSAVLYLGDEDGEEAEKDAPLSRAEPLVGGETGIADRLTRRGGGATPTMASGVVVQPRRGRLLLFTGGGENYHAPLEVARGRRRTFHAWFSCECNGSNQDDASGDGGTRGGDPDRRWSRMWTPQPTRPWPARGREPRGSVSHHGAHHDRQGSATNRSRDEL
jgi:hypothetical protein